MNKRWKNWKKMLLAMPLSVMVAALTLPAVAQAQTVTAHPPVHVSVRATMTASHGVVSSAQPGSAKAPAVKIPGNRIHPDDDWWECYPFNYAGHGCDNTDPKATDCNGDDHAMTSADGDGYQVVVYYSYSCQTVWAVLAGQTNACYDCQLNIAVYDGGCQGENGGSGSVGYPQYSVIYNGAYTNQFYLPPGYTAVASLWNPYDGDMAVSPSWPAPPYCGD
jgi:hypothetical protein